MTAAIEGSEWSAARPGRTLPPGKAQYPFYRRLGGPQGRSGRAENLVPTGIRFRTVQPVAAIPTELPGPPCVKLQRDNSEGHFRHAYSTIAFAGRDFDLLHMMGYNRDLIITRITHHRAELGVQWKTDCRLQHLFPVESLLKEFIKSNWKL